MSANDQPIVKAFQTTLKVHPNNFETTGSNFSGDDNDDAVSAQPTSVEDGSSADKISSNQFADEYIVPSLKSIRTHPWDDISHISSFLFFGIIQPLQFIALSFIPIEQWGSISKDIIHYGIKSIYTFGLHLLPYEGSVVFLFIFLLLQMIWATTLYFSKEAIGKDTKIWKTIPKMYTYLTFLCMVLYLPITSIYSTFWSCDYVNGKKEVRSDITSTITTNYYLKVYPQVKCWDSPNLVFSLFSIFGLVFHIVSIPVLFTLTVASPSSILVPTKKRTVWWHRLIKKAFFSTLLPIVPVSITIISGIFMVFQQTVPSYETYSYLYSTIMIGVTFATTGIVIYMLPYHRTKENSFQVASNLAKLGPSIVMLICSLQNTINDSQYTSGLYQWESGLVYLGSSVVLTVAIFICAFFAFQAYQKIYIAKLVKQLNEKMSDSGAFSNDLLEDIGETNMGRVAQYSLSVNDKSLSKVEMDMLAISKKIISEMKRNKLTPTNTFFASSLSCLVIKIFREKDPRYGIMYSLQLLSGQLKRRINIWDRLVITLKKHEKDVLKKREEIKPGSRKAEEIDKKISLLYKKQTQLSNLHRNYWKLVLNDNSDDSNAILQVSDDLSILQNETKAMFEELFSQHSTSVTVLRNYSRFAEKYLFQPELAEDLILQASVLEEEEECNRKKLAFKIGRRGSRAVPVFQETIDLSRFDDLDDLPDEAECLDEDNRKQKEGNKNLINKHPDFTWLLIVILIVPCYVILGITGGLIAEIIQGNSTRGSSEKGFESKVWMYYEMCDAANIPFYVLVDYRALQKLRLFSGNNAYVTKLGNDYKGRFSLYSQRIKRMMLDYSSSTDNLISAVVNGYQQTFYEVYIPRASANNSQFREGNLKKVTLSEIYSMMAVQLENIVQQDENMSLRTVENFPFMFFWENREIMPSIISNFCSTIIEDHRDLLIIQLRDFVLGMSVAMFGFMSVAFGIFAVIIYKFRDRQRLINLFKKLPKDEVGRIYQELRVGSSNDKHHISHDKKQFILTRFLRNPVFAVPTLLLLSFALGGIAFSVFIYDSTNNMNLQYSSMLKLRNSVDIQVQYHKGLFNLVELINGDSSLPTNRTQVYNEVANSMRGLVDNFLIFTRGDVEKGYNPIRSFSKDIEMLMISSTCSNNFTSNGTTINNTTDSPSTVSTTSPKTWTSNFTLAQNLEFFSCLSIEDLMSYIISGMEQFKEESFKNVHSSGYFIDIFFKDHVSLSLSFRAKVDKVLLILVSVIDNIVSITPSLIACLLIVVMCMIINYVVFRSWKIYISEMIQLRHMFHFISWETIESNESFLNYIMNYELVKKKKGSRIHPGDESADSSNTHMLKKVLDSCVDGAVIFNQEGIVENINQVALSMFGIKSRSDVVGTEFYGLFQTKDVISKRISEIAKAGNAQGETLEVEAKRSQNTINTKTFPVRLNLCVAFSGSQTKNKKVTFVGILSDVTSEKKSLELLNVEKKKSEDLLKSIFPEAVAVRLKKGDTFIAEKFDDITCFFSDMVGFTKMSSTLQPTELVEMLNDLVNGFDEQCTKYNLEKIKTIGDAYFAAGGLHGQQSDHPERVLRFSIDVFALLHKYNISRNRGVGNSINLRIGIHTGSVVAGVIGKKKFAYDLWGDAVNTASRMESTSFPGRIQVSRTTYERIHDLVLYDLDHSLNPNGKGIMVEFEEKRVEVKGKGMMQTYVLLEKFHERSLFEHLAMNIDRSQDSANGCTSIILSNHSSEKHSD